MRNILEKSLQKGMDCVGAAVFFGCWSAKKSISYNSFSDDLWFEGMACLNVGKQALCGRDGMSGPVRDLLYKMALKEQQVLLKTVKLYSITTDGWTDATGAHMATLTVHWIDESFCHKSTVACVRYLAAQNSDAIVHFLESELQEILPSGILCSIVQDNASMCKKVGRELVGSVDSVGCSAHLAHLIVTDEAIKKSQFGEAVRKMHSVVLEVKYGKLAKKLEALQEKPLSLVVSVVTRWNSMLAEISRFLDQRVLPHLIDIWKTEKTQSLFPDGDELHCLRAMVTVLEAFRLFTAEVSKEDTVLAQVPDLVWDLEDKLTEFKCDPNYFVKSFAELLLPLVRNRFGSFVEVNTSLEHSYVPLSILSAAVLPGANLARRLTVEQISFVRQAVAEEFADLHQQLKGGSSSKTRRNLVTESVELLWEALGTPVSSAQSVLHFYRRVFCDPQASLNPAESCLNDCQNFVFDSLRALLCTPASSAASERAFSSAGFLQDGRESFNKENFEKALIIRNLALNSDIPKIRALLDEVRKEVAPVPTVVSAPASTTATSSAPAVFLP